MSAFGTKQTSISKLNMSASGQSGHQDRLPMSAIDPKRHWLAGNKRLVVAHSIIATVRPSSDSLKMRWLRSVEARPGRGKAR
jgi:hypothetical protein